MRFLQKYVFPNYSCVPVILVFLIYIQHFQLFKSLWIIIIRTYSTVEKMKIDPFVVLPFLCAASDSSTASFTLGAVYIVSRWEDISP